MSEQLVGSVFFRADLPLLGGRKSCKTLLDSIGGGNVGRRFAFLVAEIRVSTIFEELLNT